MKPIQCVRLVLCTALLTACGEHAPASERAPAAPPEAAAAFAEAVTVPAGDGFASVRPAGFPEWIPLPEAYAVMMDIDAGVVRSLGVEVQQAPDAVASYLNGLAVAQGLAGDRIAQKESGDGRYSAQGVLRAAGQRVIITVFDPGDSPSLLGSRTAVTYQAFLR